MLSRHSPFSMTPTCNHLDISLMTRLSPMRCSRNRTSQSRETWSKNPRDICVSYPVDLTPFNPDRERIKRVVRPTPGPEPIAKPQELRLVNWRQDNLRHRLLDNLVLYGRDAERSCAAIRLRDVQPAVMASPGTLPSARGRAGRPTGLPTLPRTSPTSCHPHLPPRPSSTRRTPSAAHRP